MDYIERKLYLQQLIDSKDNGEIKIVTGPRRSGKSWLLKKIYRDYLLSTGVKDDNIIIVSLDTDDENSQEELTERATLKDYIYKQVKTSTERYYIFLDEIQLVDGFEKLVNGLNAKDNFDVYITGSNSKFLSSDINTIFRGRGVEIRVFPLTFNEFIANRTESDTELWKEFYTYGGMPGLLFQKTPTQKAAYLNRLWNKTYIDDCIERNHIRDKAAFESMVKALCSSIGFLTNPSRIKNILQSKLHVNLSLDTIQNYLEALEQAYLFEGAERFNIKGNKYYGSIKKYYSVDVGLRNAKLNFRQQEINHIMENIIYNELRARGFMIDVGVIEGRTQKDGKSEYVQYEIDFIATNGMRKCYIQSAFEMIDSEKSEQEKRSLKKIDDSFLKIVIVGSDVAPYTDENGFLITGIIDFLKTGADKLMD